jgi:hypothetical protein
LQKRIQSPCWLVIGNGNINYPLRNHDFTIGFNQPSKIMNHTCSVLNEKISGTGNGFTILGRSPIINFTEELNKTAHLITPQLKAWPSSGLSTLMCLNEKIFIAITGMNLLPSLLRNEHLANNKPMPNAFHNWLGERRVAQLYLLPNINWPEFWLKENITTGDKNEDPFVLLKKLPFAHGNIYLIKQLANINKEGWLQYSDTTRLLEAEQYFYISRHQQRTPNWWLFNNEASKYMAKVQCTLAWVQQQLYSANSPYS